MANKETMRMLIAGGMVASTMFPGLASAIDWNITGFVREEIALSISDQASQANLHENPDNNNNSITPGFGGLGGANGVTPLNNNAISSGANSYRAGVVNGNNPTFQGLGFANITNAGIATGAAPSACGPVGGAAGTNVCDLNGDGINDFAEPSGDYDFNLFNTRAELEIQAKFNESVAAYMRIRAYFDGTSNFADDGVRVEKHFLTDTGWGDNRGNLLEVQNNDFMLDIPSLYFDINFGSAWFRVGQQQIAWGEALFFRVFDVANGLDVRRHFFFDVGAEEYADERVASPGVRGSYTFPNGWEIDAFVQMFSPSLFPNTNTPYNVIIDGFTLGNAKFGKGFDDAENSLNVGARVIMPDLFAKDLTLSVMAVNRRNPDGVVRWDEGGGRFFNQNRSDGVGLGNNGIVPGANPFCNQNGLFIGANPNQADAATNCGHSFELEGGGTHSYLAWWRQAAYARVDPVQAAATAQAELSATDQNIFANGIGMLADGKHDFVSDAVINSAEVSAAGQVNDLSQNGVLFISPSEVAATQACTLAANCTRQAGLNRKLRGMANVSGFFTGFGPLHGFISRDYKRENILGFSFNYIITADPSSLFDQLIVRGEMSYTFDKSFTDISLSDEYTESDEILSAVILEKYQSVFEVLPATYFVFQWMHRTDTDLFGRLLTGYSSGFDLYSEDPDGSPDGQGSSDYFVFAFQQPFPNLIWRADFAMLADRRGGLFLQPGVRFKPSGEWQFDMYANIAADVGGDTDDLLESFDHMDEVFVRVTFFF